MKNCAHCNTVYADDRLNFCLKDGTPLTNWMNRSQDEATKRFMLMPDDTPAPYTIAPETLVKKQSGSPFSGSKRRAGGRKAIDSIAVLPFVGNSVDAETDYIADGITESVINELSHLRKLRVVARNTVFRYKGRGVDLNAVSRQLGVRTFLTGRVRQLGDRLMIGTELVDASTGFQLWGDHFDFKLVDIFEVQHEIAKEISKKLSLEFSNNKNGKRRNKSPTQSTEAYELYLKGRFHWNRLTEEGFSRSIEFLLAACERDPTFALAYSGLAEAYGALAYFNHVSPREAFPSAGKYAARALELDDALAEAHLTLAGVRFFYEWDWQRAEKGFKRAIDLKPSCASAHHLYAHYLTSMGRFYEAIEELELAHELDPLSLIIDCSLGFTFYRGRNYQEAIRQFRNVLDLVPTLPLAHEGLGLAYLEKGSDDEAVDEYLQGMSHWPGSDATIPALRRAYSDSRTTGFWREWIEHCGKQLQPRVVTPYHLARAFARIGETDSAFEWLEKAFEERIVFLVYLKVEPIFDSLRSDPRFVGLLSRLGLQ